jgi:membrane protein DedA with SNARE-associated domain
MNEKFAHWGFGAVAVPALLPPPFPIVPALLAAGAMQYPRKKFLTALAVGRGIRYTVVAFLGAHFGAHIVAFFSKYYKPALFTLIGMAAVSGIAIIAYLRLRRRREKLPAKPGKPAGGHRAA